MSRKRFSEFSAGLAHAFEITDVGPLEHRSPSPASREISSEIFVLPKFWKVYWARGLLDKDLRDQLLLKERVDIRYVRVSSKSGSTGGKLMKPQEWRQKLGDCVRDLFLSPEMQHFYSIEMTIERARIYLLQLGIYVRQRRNFWPQVAANCPEFEVKQRIMEHEHEELVEDEHSKAGHLDLIFRQGKELGLSVDDVLKAEALPTTKAAVYGWFWIARNRPWQEAIAASSIAEWTNDDRLLGDLGGGNCTRLYKIWKRDLNFRDEQMPNFTVHSKADVKHSDMFVDILEKYVAPGREQDVLDTAKESMDLHRAYFGGMAHAMAKVS
jgi:pyrroloquinoline quinone (PQQ) biosynthesis protein C